MRFDSSYNSWPKLDDKTVVQEMLNARESQHWHDCLNYVRNIVYAQAKNIPEEHREDIAQQVMMRIDKHLKFFKFRCALRTWIYNIIRSCIVETYRKTKYQEKHVTCLSDIHNDERYAEDSIADTKLPALEATFILQEEYQWIIEALLEYVSKHANPERNRKILEMFFLEEHTYEEIAKVVGCSAPVVGYVVRTAKTYVREKKYSQ